MKSEQDGPSLAHRVPQVIAALEKAYGSPSHGNKDDPLDELIYIKLSQQTNRPKFESTYDLLQSRFPGWQGLESVSQQELEAILRPSGLHRRRTRDIQAITGRILEDVGRLDLKWLRSLPPSEAIDYLLSLPGVGIKTASCVAMYSLGHDILPVDVHVQRISERLGLLPAGLSDQGRHERLNASIPAGKRYSYHVNCVSHGRTVCRKLPKCLRCCVQGFCEFFSSRKKSLADAGETGQCS